MAEDARIAELEALIRSAQLEIDALKNELAAAQKSYDERISKLQAQRAHTALRFWLRRQVLEWRIRSLRGWRTRKSNEIAASISSKQGWITRWKRELEKLIPPPPPPERIWLVQRERMYYARQAKSRTPSPFCEFRVFVYTEDETKYSDTEMTRLLDILEDTFGGSFASHDNVHSSTEAVMRDQVDRDEAEFDLDEIRFNVVFWRLRGSVKVVLGQYSGRIKDGMVIQE